MELLIFYCTYIINIEEIMLKFYHFSISDFQIFSKSVFPTVLFNKTAVLGKRKQAVAE